MSKVTKIVLEVGNKEIELTVKEAKELKCVLSDLFGKEVQFVPSAPTIIERNRYPYRPYEVWSGKQMGDTMYLSNAT